MRISDWSSDVCASDLLAAADDADVMAAWAGLGYYARARNLLACARAVVADHGGHFPDSEAGLRALAGVGEYTAAAVAALRSEGGRVGKGCCGMWRPRGLPVT